MTEWYTTQSLGAGLWLIDEHGHDNMYLIAGAERALLVDTGWGLGDLAGLVASLTSLPVTVINTHGHPDHILGNGQFREVHVSEDDLFLVNVFMRPEIRVRVLANIEPDTPPPTFDRERWATVMPEAILPIREGHRFDLGGRTLETIAVPGHSPGSLCLLDRDARLLFSGDTLLAGTLWLHLRDSRPLHEFRENLMRLRGFAGDFDTLMPAHGKPRLPVTLLDDIIAGIARILAGEIVGKPTHTHAGDGLRCDFGRCSILYRQDNL
jgi:glyoxylase-like metal-dependent hydrolase (beta-lactamase superfamily II)